jgi:hypothetical protein
MIITGGCRCRAVRYKIEADRITARHCWWHRERLLPERGGESRGRSIGLYEPRRKRQPGAPAILPTCGTPLFTQSDARRHMIGVRAGTLDDPEIGKPQITIWTSSAPSWAVFDANIPQDEKQSPPLQRENLRGLNSLEAAFGGP